jgi:hypothetical protein
MTKVVLGLENLTLSEVKAHLYIDNSLDDTLLQSYIDASLLAVVNYIHSDVLLSEYTSTATEIENNIYYLKNTPKMVKLDGVELTRDQYLHYDGRLYITDTTLEVLTSVVCYTGYTTIPININQARKLLIGSWYDNRESNIVNNKNSILPHGLEFLLDGEMTGAI